MREGMLEILDMPLCVLCTVNTLLVSLARCRMADNQGVGHTWHNTNIHTLWHGHAQLTLGLTRACEAKSLEIVGGRDTETMEDKHKERERER